VAVQVEDGILKYITDIAQISRKSLDLVLGGSPRASIGLLLAAKTWAAMQGRSFVVPDDVKFLVRPVYRHRIILKPEAEIEGLTPDTAIQRMLSKVEVPR
jgi:MoxR-like ATPase